MKSYRFGETGSKPLMLSILALSLIVLFPLLFFAACQQQDKSPQNAEISESSLDASATQSHQAPSSEMLKSDRPLRLGFVPLTEQDQLIESVRPLAELIEKGLLDQGIQQKVEAFTAANYVGVVEALGSGQVDIALLPPLAYVLAHKENGTQILLSAINKEGKKSYVSELVVRQDDPAQKVEDLQNHVIAFVDPSSTSGYLYPAALLKQKGISLDEDQAKILFAGGHDAALLSLINKDADVACVYKDARQKLLKDHPEIMEQTRILAYTSEIPYIALTASKDLDPQRQEAIKKVFLTQLSTGDGQALISKLFNLYGFTEIDDQAYDPIREVAKAMDIQLSDVQ